MAVLTKTTTCIMDCPDTCELSVEVTDDKISKISAAKNGHPNTNGFICNKVSRYGERVYHKDRVRYPMRRVGAKGEGRFERVSWDEAIAQIVDNFQQTKARWGGEAILPYHYGGSNGLLGDSFIDHYFFAKLGASKLAKTICAVPTTTVATEMYGKMPGVAFEDYPAAKCIIVWGANPKASNIHLTPYLKQAKKNGAFIAVVDPKKNFSNREADLHLPVYPGADLPLALAMINFWRDRDLIDYSFLENHAEDYEPLLEASREWTLEKAAKVAHVSADAIKKLATVYAKTSPAVMRCGWGVERNQNGGRAVAAIMAMPALLGKFGVQGGGYTMSNSGAVDLKTDKIFGDFEWNTREFNMTQLGAQLNDDMLTPPIKSLFVYNCNPVATVPDQNAIIRGLKRDDLFTTVFEQVMTDTAQFADVILPAATFLEQREIRRGYGSYVVGGIQPTIAPEGETRPNEEVFAELGRAMGWDDPQFSWSSDMFFDKTVAALDLNGEGGNGDVLREGGIQNIPFDEPGLVQFKTIFPKTANGKVQLNPPCLGEKGYHFVPVKDDDFPLALISPATTKMVSSTFGEFNYKTLKLNIHPDDARARNIQNGEKVKVFNRLGEVVCFAAVTRQIRQGVVLLPKGAWMKSSQNGKTSTALCPDSTDNVGGGACFNDARVEVETV